jgi:hypothetical protein
MTVHNVHTPEPGAREAFLRERGITISWEHLGGDPCLGELVQFRFVLKRRGREGEPLLVWEEFPYRAGWGLYTEISFMAKPPYPMIKPLVPEVESFLECLRNDCLGLSHGEDFDSFVDEMGMNGNAKEALKCWEAIQKEWARLQRILGEDAKAFVALDIEAEWV